MFKACIIRDQSSKFQTLGRFFLSNGTKIFFEARTLELPFRANKRNISSIPDGIYAVVTRESPKFGYSFHIVDVPRRSHILIHPGNFHTQLNGCILIGSHFKHINSDGVIDVANSLTTIRNLQAYTDSFQLQIITL